MKKRRITVIEGETGLETTPKNQETIDLEKYVDMFNSVTKHIQNFAELPTLKQNEIAKRLGMAESQLSKWLSGFQNLTLKSLIKLEVVSDIGILNPALFYDIKPTENDLTYTALIEKKAVVEPYSYENFKCVWSNGNYKQEVNKEMAVVIEIKSLSDLPKEAASYG